MRRFSIARLMTLTFTIALAVAALRDASDTWAGVLFGVTLLLLATSLLGVLQRREAKRAGWQGFAIFGWGYLLLALGPWLEPSKLTTTQLLDALHARISSEKTSITSSATVTQLANGMTTIAPGPQPVSQAVAFYLVPTNQEQFRRVGHCLFSLVFALVGMGVGRWFQRTSGTASA